MGNRCLPDFWQAPVLRPYRAGPLNGQAQERGGGLEVDQHRPGIHNGSDEGGGHDGRIHVELLGGNGQHTAHQLGQHHRGRQGQGDHQGDGAVMVLKVDPQAVGRG